MHVYLYFVFNFHVFTFSCAGPSLLHTGYSPIAGCGLLTVVASLVVERRLSSCGVWAELPLGHAGSSWTRDQTHAPALVGRFLTIGPPGKSYMYYLFIFYVLYLHKIRTFLCILIIIWCFSLNTYWIFFCIIMWGACYTTMQPAPYSGMLTLYPSFTWLQIIV